MPHILTVDVEDWFHTQAVSEKISVSDWEKYPVRIHRNVARILELFNRRQTRATFFVLGWIAEKYPELIEQIDQAGHEIASHGYAHQLIYNQSEDEFHQDVQKSLEILETITGYKILGYRAPSFSVREGASWIFPRLKALGICYDSSIFPIWHDLYGIPAAPRFAFPIKLESGQVIWEFPLSTMRILGCNIPLAGGGYLRLFPYWFTRRGLKRLESQNQMGIVYLHPWELDLEQPRPELSRVSRFRQYTNLRTTRHKLEMLLYEFEFITMGEAYRRLICSKT